jgi:hypothetical protein
LRDATGLPGAWKRLVKRVGCGAVGFVSSAGATGAQGGQAASTSVGRDRALWKIDAWRSFSSSHPARLPELLHLTGAAIPIEADTGERSEEPKPVPLGHGCFRPRGGVKQTSPLPGFSA